MRNRSSSTLVMDALPLVEKISPFDFIAAASNGDVATVQLYLAQNAENADAVNVRQYNFAGTALIEAADNGFIDIVKLLLAAPGIKPNIQSEDDETAIMAAAASGHLDVVRTLLADPRIDVNGAYNLMHYMRDDLHKGDTLLMWAYKKKHYDIFNAILGANNLKVDAANMNGNTVLLLASAMGDIKYVKPLLNHSPNLDATRSDGETALSLARKEGHHAIVELLLKARYEAALQKAAEILDEFKQINKPNR